MPRHSLDQVIIDGFRGLRGLRLDDLGRINILVGPNNCGKTSVLEALSILCDPFNPYEWLAVVRRRDFGGLDETPIQSLRWCFTQHGDLADPEASFDGECEMTCSGTFPLRKLSVSYDEIVGEPDRRQLRRAARAGILYRRRHDATEPLRGAELSHEVVLDTHAWKPTEFGTSGSTTEEVSSIQIWEDVEMIREPRRRAQGRHLKSQTLTPYSYQINQLQVRARSKGLFSHQRELVLDLVRQFDADVEDIELASFRGERPAIYVKHRRLGPAPLSVFGDAFRRAVLLASCVADFGAGGVLLIDELETGIHVSVLDGVFAWLMAMARQFQFQVVATTHSLEAVDAIALAAGAMIDDLVTFHLEQQEEATQVRRIDGDLLLRLRRERGLDVR